MIDMFQLVNEERIELEHYHFKPLLNPGTKHKGPLASQKQ